MTTPTSLPLDFPPLLALAEAQVRANWPTEEQTRARLGHDVRGDTLDDYGAEVRAFFIGCEVDRLRDLTRPASRDAWLRRLGAALGWPESEHCPTFEHDGIDLSPRDRDGAPDREDYPASWRLMRADGSILTFCAPDPEWTPKGWIAIPDLDVSGPDAWPVALCQVILMCGGAS